MTVRAIHGNSPILKIALPNVEMTYSDTNLTITVPAEKLGVQIPLEIFNNMQVRGYRPEEGETYKFYLSKDAFNLIIFEQQVLDAYQSLLPTP